jgi:transposase InsO family protein
VNGIKQPASGSVFNSVPVDQVVPGKFGIQLSASRPSSPWQNGFMERCIKSIKEELGPLANYRDIDELYVGITNAIAYYNNDRIHTALGMSPKSYARHIGRPRKSANRLSAVFGKRGA